MDLGKDSTHDWGSIVGSRMGFVGEGWGGSVWDERVSARGCWKRFVMWMVGRNVVAGLLMWVESVSIFCLVANYIKLLLIDITKVVLDDSRPTER